MAAKRASAALADYTLARQLFAQDCAKSAESKAGAKVLVAGGALPLLVDMLSSAPSWPERPEDAVGDKKETWLADGGGAQPGAVGKDLDAVRMETARLAAAALAHLAAYNVTAKHVAKPSVLSALVEATQLAVIGDLALHALTSLSAHSAELAARCVSSGCLTHAFCRPVAAPPCLPALRLAAELARHGADLARAVLETPGCLDLVDRCLHLPVRGVSSSSASCSSSSTACSWTAATRALGLLAMQDEALAVRVAQSGALQAVATRLSVPALKLEALTALWSVARHSAPLAELVATLDDDVMGAVVAAVLDHKEAVRHAAVLLLRDLCKRTLQLSQLAVDAGAGCALTQLLKDTPGLCRLHAAVALGYLAAHSPVLALAVIAAKAVEGLVAVLRDDGDEAVLEAAAWALGQLGRHSAKHVEEIAGQHVLTSLAEVMSRPCCSEDVSAKAMTAMEHIIPRCKSSTALQPLLHQTHPHVLALTLRQLAKILPNDPRGRRLLVCTGGLRRLQEIPAEPGSAIAESVAVINCCFPKEIVRYYSPGFPDTLLDLIEDFDPLAPVQREWPDPAPRSVAATASATSTATMLVELAAPATASSSRTSFGEAALLQAEAAKAVLPAEDGAEAKAAAVTRSCVSLATSASACSRRGSRRCSSSRTRRARKSRSRTTSRPRRQTEPEGVAAATGSPSTPQDSPI